MKRNSTKTRKAKAKLLDWKTISRTAKLKPLPKIIAKQVLCKQCRRATDLALYTDQPKKFKPFGQQDAKDIADRKLRELKFDRIVLNIQRSRRVWCKSHAEEHFG